MKKASTEYAIFVCFDLYMFAHTPLQDDDLLGRIPVPVSIIFGDSDWMHQYGSERIIKNNPYPEHSHFYMLKNSDHHLHFDNPQDLCNILLEDLKNV